MDDPVAYWRDEAQSYKAKFETAQAQIDRVTGKYGNILDTLCAKEKSDGTIDIDFEGLVTKLSLEHALELRATIDSVHRVRGEAGEKPKITVSA